MMFRNLLITIFTFCRQISGEFSNVQDALYNATGRLRDHLFVSTQNSAGTRNLSSVPADTSPYGRLRDPVPLGGSPIAGVSHSLGKHSLSQNLDHLAIPPNLDHPSSPGLWAPQVYCFLSAGSFTFPSFPYYMVKFACRMRLG